MVLAFACCAALPAKSEKKPLLGIKTFENPPNYHSSTLCTGLTDLFITELSKTKKYRIIERAKVDELVKEVNFGKSGYVDKESSVRKGHIKGVEYLFFAKVTNFGAKKNAVVSNTVGRIFKGVGVQQEKADVRIDFRIVDATTGETVFADSGEGEEESRGLAIDSNRWGSGARVSDFQSSEFLSSQLGKATIKALKQIISKLDDDFLTQVQSGAATIKGKEAAAQQEAKKVAEDAPGAVTMVEGQTVYVDLGSNHGLKVGDTLKVYKLSEKKNKSGQVVFTEEVSVGKLKVTAVNPDSSKTVVALGKGFEEGQLVKRE